MLLVGVETANLVGNRSQRSVAGMVTMLVQALDQRLLSELLAGIVVGFGDAVGVESEQVSRKEGAFSERTIPLLEQAEESSVGLEFLDRSIGAQNQA